ncbi:tyrosine-type recombinase/integrase [Streptosporangium canum]|uniref:tyrosine-type recombinase/integrase n=1 Tax=Streptosporangium canum TaxID=324952 RepID=UPI003434EE8F
MTSATRSSPSPHLDDGTRVNRLCEVPEGKEGHPSKALTLDQAEAVLKATEGTRMHAYVVLKEDDLVFASLVGTPLDSHNVRRAFRKIVKDAGLTAQDWTPLEMRHSFASLLSDSGVPLEDIARLVGRSGTAVTEAVYRKQIRPALIGGAEAMDRIFTRQERQSPRMQKGCRPCG